MEFTLGVTSATIREEIHPLAHVVGPRAQPVPKIDFEDVDSLPAAMVADGVLYGSVDPPPDSASAADRLVGRELQDVLGGGEERHGDLKLAARGGAGEEPVRPPRPPER